MLGIYAILGTVIGLLAIIGHTIYKNRATLMQVDKIEPEKGEFGASLVSKKGLLGHEQSVAKLLETRLLRTLHIQTEIIRKIATNAPLQKLLEEIALFLEREVGEIQCAIMLADTSSMKLYCGAAPHLPEEFVRIIDGVSIKEGSTACSLATMTGEVVISENMMEDVVWSAFHEELAQFDIRSCCAAPLLSKEMKMLGTIAFYSKRLGRPDSVTLSYLQIALDLAAIALEHQHRDRNTDEKEANLHALFNNDTQINVLIDKFGQIRRINETGIQTGKKLFGKIASPGDHVARILPENMLKSFDKAMAKALNGEAVRVNRYAGSIDGETYWYEVAYLPIKSKNGKIATVSLSAFDITEKIHTENELVNYQQRLQALVQNSTDVITIVSVDGTIVFESPSVEQISGYLPQELIGKSGFDYIHPDDRDYVRQLFADAVQKGQFNIPSVEVRVQHKDGQWIYVEMVGTVMLDNQAINGVIVTSRLIDERKAAEMALRQSEERFRAIFENTGIGIILASMDGEIIETNFAFQQMLDYSGAELKQRKMGDVVWQGDTGTLRKSSMKEFLGKQDSRQMDMRFIRSDNRTILVRMTTNLVKNAEEEAQFAVCMIEDVTDQFRATHALKKSEEKYRTLFRGIPVGLYRTTPDGRILDANPALVSMLGYDDKNSLRRVPAKDLYVSAADRSRWYAIIEQVGLVRSFEVKLKRQDSSEIRVRENSSAVKDRHGNILYIEGSIEDVTVQRRMEDRLALSEEQYRDLVENSEDFIFTHDMNGIVLSANRAVIKQLGYQYTAEMVGKPLADMLRNGSGRLVPLYLKKIARKKHFSGNVTVVTSGGDERILEFRNSVRHVPGEAPAVRGIARDVTQKIRTQHALALEKERLSVTLRSIGDGVITLDLAGNVLLMNNVACDLISISHDSWRGKRIDDIFRIKQTRISVQYENTLQSVLDTGRSIRMEQAVRLLSFDGHERMVTFYATPLHDKANRQTGAVIVFRDVGKMLTLEEQVGNAYKLESLGLLAGGIAHDFNNYLTVIMGNISLAKTACEANDPMHTRLYEVERAAERAQMLTQQLLTFARGGAPIKKTASLVDIVRVTTEFVLTGRSTMADYQILEEIWPVEVDKGQISQVINNLVINASQAMSGAGQVSISCKNEAIDSHNQRWSTEVIPGDYVVLTIQDRGEGIPAVDLPYIFDPYFTTKNQGNGLGLAISFSIIKRHDGCIFVASEPGVGTTFTILLPANPEAVINYDEYAEGFERGSGRILVMDDEESIREVLSRILEMLGYTVETAVEGSEAIELYKRAMANNDRFDAVIMDLTVPGGIGGKEAVKTLLQLDSNLKAIVSSGYSNDPVMARYLEYGFIDRIMKPYNTQFVSKVLKRALSAQPVAQGDINGE